MQETKMRCKKISNSETSSWRLFIYSSNKGPIRPPTSHRYYVCQTLIAYVIYFTADFPGPISTIMSALLLFHSVVDVSSRRCPLNEVHWSCSWLHSPSVQIRTLGHEISISATTQSGVLYVRYTLIQEALLWQRDRETRFSVYRKACNRWMTLTHTQDHHSCCY